MQPKTTAHVRLEALTSRLSTARRLRQSPVLDFTVILTERNIADQSSGPQSLPPAEWAIEGVLEASKEDRWISIPRDSDARDDDRWTSDREIDSANSEHRTRDGNDARGIGVLRLPRVAWTAADARLTAIDGSASQASAAGPGRHQMARTVRNNQEMVHEGWRFLS